eukprot:464431-Rhodomonas_salina.1
MARAETAGRGPGPQDKQIGVDFAPYLEDLQDHVEQRIDDFRGPSAPVTILSTPVTILSTPVAILS